jgi:predicted negative regulator of RcsB-dependent stress response
VGCTQAIGKSFAALNRPSRMPATGAAARPPIAVDEDSFFEWIQLHARELTVAAVVVLAAIGGAMLYRSASATQAAQAEQALVGPEQSITAGNLPLAQADLKRVIARYGGTAAAAQAAMLLAETYYTQQKFSDGLAALAGAPTTGAAKPFASAVEQLIGVGYLQQGKARTAALHFTAAADKTVYPIERARLRANAAQAYAASGDTVTAIGIWQQLAGDPKSGEVPEAQLRLGELTARRAKP